MKLKTIKYLSKSFRYIIFVLGDNHIIDGFKIDYLGNETELKDAILKYFKYENCKVKGINTHIDESGKDWLVIDIKL